MHIWKYLNVLDSATVESMRCTHFINTSSPVLVVCATLMFNVCSIFHDMQNNWISKHTKQLSKEYHMHRAVCVAFWLSSFYPYIHLHSDRERKEAWMQEWSEQLMHTQRSHTLCTVYNVCNEWIAVEQSLDYLKLYSIQFYVTLPFSASLSLSLPV